MSYIPNHEISWDVEKMSNPDLYKLRPLQIHVPAKLGNNLTNVLDAFLNIANTLI